MPIGRRKHVVTQPYNYTVTISCGRGLHKRFSHLQEQGCAHHSRTVTWWIIVVSVYKRTKTVLSLCFLIKGKSLLFVSSRAAFLGNHLLNCLDSCFAVPPCLTLSDLYWNQGQYHKYVSSPVMADFGRCCHCTFEYSGARGCCSLVWELFLPHPPQWLFSCTSCCVSLVFVWVFWFKPGSAAVSVFQEGIMYRCHSR